MLFTKVIKCNEVWIRFVLVNHAGQRIRYQNGPTAAHYLQVTQDATTLTVAFCSKNGDILRSLNFNYSHVLEYDCTEQFP